MKNRGFKNIFLIALLITSVCTSCENKSVPSLKNSFKNDFNIGVAMNSDQIIGKDSSSVHLIVSQFNSVVPENCMKAEVIHPKEGSYDFTLADQFVDFGLKHKMKIIGHTLIWHSQVPAWFFVDENGVDVSKEVLIKRMKDHISTVVGRYKGKVAGWDVVNEALNEDGSLRQSKFYQIIGPEFLQLAFEFAHDADPDAELYYNDYNLYKPAKRFGVIEMVNVLRENGCRIDAVGEQAHYGLGMPVLTDLEKTIVAFSEMGLKTSITELDVSVLPFPSEEITAEVSQSYTNKPEFDPYVNQLPDSIDNQFTKMYVDLFKIFLRHKDVISRVTFWGVNDGQSWRNYWPIPGRTDYPLLFDRANKPKKAVEAIINETKVSEKK